MNERTNRSFVSGRLNRLGGLAMPILVAFLGLTSCSATDDEPPSVATVETVNVQSGCGEISNDTLNKAMRAVAGESLQKTYHYLDPIRNAEMAAELDLTILIADAYIEARLQSDDLDVMMAAANEYLGQFEVSISVLDETVVLGGDIFDSYFVEGNGDITELRNNIKVLIKMFEQLPKELFDKIELNEIILTGQMGEYKNENYKEPTNTFSGTVSFDERKVYLLAQPDEYQTQSTALHEIGHLLDDLLCDGILDVDPEYTSDNSTKYVPEKWMKKGGENKDYVSSYSWHGVAEDRAEVWERLLAGNEMHSRYIAENIHKKFALLLARLEELIPGISLYLQHHDGGRHTDWRALVLHK